LFTFSVGSSSSSSSSASSFFSPASDISSDSPSPSFLFFENNLAKGFESLQQTQICHPQYLSNLMVYILNISNSSRMNSLKYQRSTTFGCKDIEIRKSEFVVKTQFLCRIKHR